MNGNEPQDNSKPSMEPLLLGRVELAAALGIGPATLDRLDQLGKLPRALPLCRGRKLWSRDEIVAWISAGTPARAEWEAMRSANGRHTPPLRARAN